jgi:hypothetical protein
VGSHAKIYYCGTHLPKFLQTEKYSALLEGTDFLEEKRQTAMQKLSFPSQTAPVPLKKRTRKKPVEVKPTEDEAVGTLEVHDELPAEES